MKKKILPLGMVALGIISVFEILLVQGAVWGFGFEKKQSAPEKR